MRERNREQIENAIFLILITGIAMLTRLSLFPFESCDYYQFLRDWYAALQANGGFAAVGMSIGDYMPTYLYLLAGMTYLPVSDLAGIKLISCIADVLLAYFVRKIVNLHFGEGYGTAAYAVILFLPSVVLNSAAWGQCDAIFTAALAASVYFLMTEREACAVTAFAVSFVFKLQAVFLAPFFFPAVPETADPAADVRPYPAGLRACHPSGGALRAQSLGAAYGVYLSVRKVQDALHVSAEPVHLVPGGYAGVHRHRGGVFCRWAGAVVPVLPL